MKLLNTLIALLIPVVTVSVITIFLLWTVVCDNQFIEDHMEDVSSVCLGLLADPTAFLDWIAMEGMVQPSLNEIVSRQVGELYD